MSESADLRVVFVAGVRPQFIKIAALQRSIAKFNESAARRIAAHYINSGQHYDSVLCKQLIDELSVHFDFELSHTSQDPVRLTASMLTGIYEILSELLPPPNWVLVLGDTNTTLAGALAAALARLRVVHIEAGVRSGDLTIPEEINRRVVDHISTVHFCTSKSSTQNLAAENISRNVLWTGDLAHDFFQEYSQGQPEGVDFWPYRNYVLVTIHKPGNLRSDKTLPNLIDVLTKQPRPVIFIMHPNCKRRLEELGLLSAPKQIRFIESVTFGRMISAMKGCAYIITDSGGVQREAYYLRKRCLLRRDSVGWSAFVDAGIHRLIGSDRTSIRSGLAWVETAIASSEYRTIDEFVRPHGIKSALETLIQLGPQ